MRNKTQGTLLPSLSVILSGVTWGVISLFIRPLSEGGLEPLQIALIRMTISVLLLWGFMLIFCRGKLRIRLRDLWIFVCTGIVSLTFFNATYFYTMIHAQSSVAVVLLYTSPAFVMILSAIFFHESLSVKKLVALGLTLGGCVLVTGMIGGSYRLTPLVILTGVGSGLFYALYTIFGRIALSRYDSMTVTAYTFLFGLIGALPFGKLPETVGTLIAKPELILFCLAVGFVSTVTPYFLYTWGLERMESGKAAILVAVEPLVGAVIGMTVWNEPHDILKLIGIAAILVAVILLSLPGKNKPVSDK